MLVLSRKQGESVRIADEITITIVELGRRRVRLGISAPINLPVYREELAQRAPNPRGPNRAMANATAEIAG